MSSVGKAEVNLLESVLPCCQTAPEHITASATLLASPQPRSIQARSDGSAVTFLDVSRWQHLDCWLCRRCLILRVRLSFFIPERFVSCPAFAMARDPFSWGFFRKLLYVQVGFREIPVYFGSNREPIPALFSLETKHDDRQIGGWLNSLWILYPHRVTLIDDICMYLYFGGLIYMSQTSPWKPLL